jgi:septum formation protein
LLGVLGLRFDVQPPDVDETPLAGEAPRAYVERLAAVKAEAAASDGAVVIAADTTVVIDGDILGKPADAGEAHVMLGRLSGRWHEVLTGVAVVTPDGRHATGVASSQVRMAVLSAQRIAWYVGTGEPLDRAGAYAIQGHGSLLVEEVRGNYTNVVGLPVPLVAALCERLGIDLLSFRADSSRQ